MKIKTKSGTVIRLIGWKADYDRMFLLIELQNRVPEAFLACTRDDLAGVHIIRIGELAVDAEQVAFMNGVTLGGGKRPANDA